MQLEIWQAVVLGIVEGITEYLPISSTGHLILVAGLMGLGRDPQSKQSIDAFNIVVQGGAILAVVGLYWPSVLRMLKGLTGRDAQGLRLLLNLLAAFVPAAVLGKLLDDWIESQLFHPGPVLAAVLVGGIYMLVVDRWSRRRSPPVQFPSGEMTIFDITPWQAFKIGCLQCLAMWPGTSRSMMTITGGMFAGLRPRQAAEFSFLLGLPTLTAATGYKLVKNLVHARTAGVPNLFDQLGLLSCGVGIVVAAISAAVAVKWLVGFLSQRGLGPFGWYRIVLFLALSALLNIGVVTIE
jgi:undecaprenyl-diphosphatase